MDLKYGMNVHLSGNEVLEKMKEAGIKWYRIDVNWFEAEPEKNKFNWGRIDRVVTYCKENGISIFASIGYTPGWANSNKGHYYPADNISDWENFVKIAAERYREDIRHWGIWNEMNLHFWALSKEAFVEKIFFPAEKVIKNVDSQFKILGPELAHMTGLNHLFKGSHWYGWMKYLLEKCGKHIDIITHHVYKKRGAKYIYRAFEKRWFLIKPSVLGVIKRTGNKNKPLWLTETGWHMKEVTEDEQADKYLELLNMRLKKRYPENLFFYVAHDDPNPDVNHFGVLRSDYSEKKSYNVLKDFISGKGQKSV